MAWWRPRRTPGSGQCPAVPAWRPQLGVLRVQAGLGEDVLVVEEDHGVGLPGQLVHLAVAGLVLVREVTGAVLDVLGAVRELVQRHQPALLLELRNGNGCGVEDQAGGVAGGDRGADDFLGALAGRDLLGVDLLLRVCGVPGFHHGFAPFHLELVVGVPDLDGALGRRWRSRRNRRRPPPPPQAARPAPMTVRAATDNTRVALVKRFIATPWESCVGIFRLGGVLGVLRWSWCAELRLPGRARWTRGPAGRVPAVRCPRREWVPLSWFRRAWAATRPQAWGRWRWWSGADSGTG